MNKEKIPILEEWLLEDLLNKTKIELSVPNYQRPYKWKKEHVIQLLDDLYENIYLKSGVVYRIGSIIIHKYGEIKKNNDIVDGQQRLITLSLILYSLGLQDVLLQNHVFENTISKNNIHFNYQQIEKWFSSKVLDKGVFLEKIKQGCQIVLVTVFDEDEAFQLFDSQNSRGKPLYPHDLLKAFHLREMEKDQHSEHEMEVYAEKWEGYILEDGNPLLETLHEYLFRIRNWTKLKKKYYFTKEDISEFKGISLNKPKLFRHEAAFRILDEKDRCYRNFNISQDYPFQISMPIINGKIFFDYVFHYIELKKELFSCEKNKAFFDFYKDNCFGHGRWWRKGDEKVRNLYENICFHFVDRFDVSYLSKMYYEEFYKNSYQLRLESKSIDERNVMNFKNGQKFFSLIENSYSPEGLQSDLHCSYNEKWRKENYVLDVEKMYELITGLEINETPPENAN